MGPTFEEPGEESTGQSNGQIIFAGGEGLGFEGGGVWGGDGREGLGLRINHQGKGG